MSDPNTTTPVAQPALPTLNQPQQEAYEGFEIGEEPAAVTANPKSSQMSKLMINISFIVLGVCGIVGSFWTAFDMTKYVEFLKVFAYIWAPLVIAVGGGRAFKNFINKKYVDPAATAGGVLSTSARTTGAYRTAAIRPSRIARR